MMRLLAVLFLAILLLGCTQSEAPKLEKNLEVKSVFKNGELIPKKYTCDGEDISPPLELVNLSPKAKSIAIIMEDPDAPMGTFTHWIIWDIPPTHKIPEGIPRGKEITKPFKAYQGRNDFGYYGYGGPCPPKGKPHRYVFKVYVLDTVLNLKDATKEQLLKAMRGHIIQYGELVGLYGR